MHRGSRVNLFAFAYRRFHEDFSPLNWAILYYSLDYSLLPIQMVDKKLTNSGKFLGKKIVFLQSPWLYILYVTQTFMSIEG